jgi:hypothetical protein
MLALRNPAPNQDLQVMLGGSQRLWRRRGLWPDPELGFTQAHVLFEGEAASG